MPPSIGNVHFELSLQQQYKDRLSEFSNVSCREKSGAHLLEGLLNKEVPVVLDPTMLFDAEQWLNWFPVAVESNKKPFILVYCFGGVSDSMDRQLQELGQKLSMHVRYILSPSIKDTVGELKYGDGAYGPAEYVQLFSVAAFTVVNGYHGLLFSLIFEKPFVLLHRNKNEHWGTHENRMGEILKAVHLEERYVSPDEKIKETMLSLDYSDARKTIAEMREQSWNYLKEALQ